jgi:nucleotide-binding universal stress UspA family protein
MRELRKILVPVDFSAASEAAAEYGYALAERYRGECTLVHVLPPLEFSFAMVSPLPSREDEIAAGRTEAALHALDRMAAPRAARRMLREGDPAEMIVAAANEGHFDAIVMPTRGAPALRRWLLIGSVTAKVLSAAECPVWTGVHWPASSEGLSIDSIICALDPVRRSDNVLCFAWTLARRFDARLTVVHAMPPAGEAGEDFFDESWRMTLRGRLEERIQALLAAASADAQIVIEPGKPASVVAQVARSRRAGLVVLGRGESNGVFNKLRADGYEIIRQAPCPAVGV